MRIFAGVSYQADLSVTSTFILRLLFVPNSDEAFATFIGFYFTTFFTAEYFTLLEDPGNFTRSLLS